MSGQFDKTGRTASSAWQKTLIDLAQTVRFFSRLPVPQLPFESGDVHAAPAFPALVRVVPLAGLIIGILPGLVLMGALALDLGPFLAATLSVATLTLITGGLHEDGLADTADSFGGATRERRLAIMRDSRIGSFGASALILCFALRIGALAAIAPQTSAFAAMLAVMIAAALSRTASLMPLAFLSPARADGASHAVGLASREAFWFAAAVAAALALVIGFLTELETAGTTAMTALAGLAGWGMTRFAARHLGGHTGDIAGAAQQVAEIAALIGLLIVLGR
jgi:adenosylcobinamide-GDP ribazoletransferase